MLYTDRVGLEIVGMLLAGAGASYGWWRLQSRRERRLGLLRGKTFDDYLDPDAKVIMHVARHAATSRQHRYMTPLHVLYGIAQDETFVAALAKLEGDASALEQHLLDELEDVKQDALPEEETPYQTALGRAATCAIHQDREVRCVDLFAYLVRVEEFRTLLAPGKVDPYALLFELVHGMAEPTTDVPDRTDVHVVLRNDDFTTQEFVSRILGETFALPPDQAHARMMQTHTEGRAIVGRFKLAEARQKIDAVRALAREQSFPLWIGVEDC
jgi:ATP-dependent Clp protease adaptor protein ClpS